MPIFETNKEFAIDIIKKLVINHSYKKIYLSFGSKYNEKQVIYDSQSITNRITNSPFQMIPAFLRDETQPILSICMDDFSNIENKEINQKIIGSVIKDSIDFVFVDWHLEVNDLFIFLKSFLQICLENDIQSQQLYCVLYFKFMHPNRFEQTFSEKMMETAISIFKDSLYQTSLYMWFGYQPNLYNCIYPAYYSFAYYTYNITIIQKKFTSDTIDPYDIESWVSTLDPYTQIRMMTLFTNCFDITQYSNDGNLWSIYRPNSI